MSDDFAERLERALGLTLKDLLILGMAQADRRAELIREAGFCCEAMATGHSPNPEVPSLPCPWHGPGGPLHPFRAKDQS